MGEAIPQVPVATQLAVVMTPTRTSILYEAGPVNVNATYLSPVMVCPRVLIFERNLHLNYVCSQMILSNNHFHSLITIYPSPATLHIISEYIAI